MISTWKRCRRRRRWKLRRIKATVCMSTDAMSAAVPCADISITGRLMRSIFCRISKTDTTGFPLKRTIPESERSLTITPTVRAFSVPRNGTTAFRFFRASRTGRFSATPRMHTIRRVSAFSSDGRRRSICVMTTAAGSPRKRISGFRLSPTGVIRRKPFRAVSRGRRLNAAIFRCSMNTNRLLRRLFRSLAELARNLRRLCRMPNTTLHGILQNMNSIHSTTEKSRPRIKRETSSAVKFPPPEQGV